MPHKISPSSLKYFRENSEPFNPVSDHGQIIFTFWNLDGGSRPHICQIICLFECRSRKVIGSWHSVFGRKSRANPWSLTLSFLVNEKVGWCTRDKSRKRGIYTAWSPRKHEMKSWLLPPHISKLAAGFGKETRSCLSIVDPFGRRETPMGVVFSNFW